MKISNLINILQRCRLKHGNIETTIELKEDDITSSPRSIRSISVYRVTKYIPGYTTKKEDILNIQNWIT